MTVPLSEREQRILEDIEKSLYDEDPKFARHVRQRVPRWHGWQRLKAGLLLFAAGFLMLLLFFFKSALVFGALAFGAMVGGIVLAAGAVRAFAERRPGAQAEAKDRLQQRISDWQERFRNRYKRS